MKLKREEGLDKPIFPFLGTLSVKEFVFCSLNLLFGVGALRLGSAFNSGILFTHLLNTFVALVSLYSLKLYIYSAAIYQSSTFEEIWSSAFSRSTVIIPAFLSLTTSITNVKSYINFLQGSAVTIISMILKLAMDNPEETIEEMERYRFLIGLIIVIIFCIPICLSDNLHHIVDLSYISVTLFFVIVLYIIIRFITISVKDGFDHKKQFKLVDLNGHISGTISALIFSYLPYPFAWPGLRHSKNPSINNLSKIFYIVIGICYSAYAVVGTFSYLTFFTENTGGIIFNYYPNHTQTDQILLIFGHIVTFIYVLLTIPLVLNSARYILLNALHKIDKLPKDVWGTVGITLALVCLTFANLNESVTTYFSMVSDLFGLILIFIFPPVFYLKGYKLQNKIHFIGSILELLIGIASIAFTIYLDCE